MKIGIFVAMQEEAEQTIQALHLLASRQQPFKCSRVYQSADESIVLITPQLVTVDGTPISRAGKVAAAQSTALLIEHFKPDLIINPGTAGGIKERGACVGDVYTGSVQQHDAFMAHPVYQQHACRVLQTQGPEICTALNIKVKEGMISTGESFKKSDDEWRRIETSDAVVLEMEAFAVAEVVNTMMPLKNNKLPLVCIKGITDAHNMGLLDAQGHQMYEDNLKMAMDGVLMVLAQLLEKSRENTQR